MTAAVEQVDAVALGRMTSWAGGSGTKMAAYAAAEKTEQLDEVLGKLGTTTLLGTTRAWRPAHWPSSFCARCDCPSERRRISPRARSWRWSARAPGSAVGAEPAWLRRRISKGVLNARAALAIPPPQTSRCSASQPPHVTRPATARAPSSTRDRITVPEVSADVIRARVTTSFTGRASTAEPSPSRPVKKVLQQASTRRRHGTRPGPLTHLLLGAGPGRRRCGRSGPDDAGGRSGLSRSDLRLTPAIVTSP